MPVTYGAGLLRSNQPVLTYNSTHTCNLWGWSTPQQSTCPYLQQYPIPVTYGAGLLRSNQPVLTYNSTPYL